MRKRSAILHGRHAAHAQTAGADNSAIYLYKGADRDQRLIAKAREEGTLTFYTSMATTESGPLAQAFEKKYGVKVQLWRALSENVLQRALTEARGGRRSMDVVETNAPEVEALAREQAVAEFDSPYLADLPPWAIPPHRRWFSDRANLWVDRLQHRQGQARGTARDRRGLRRSEMEGAALDRGDRQRLDVRRHAVSWARRAASNSSAGSRR